ncbi:hypothetical protein [Bradyrhizobium liaoningense]|uniref:hypothetical protein n=1 Tax=Bradyrhizobium liaoningense TaxID=43992 RepID=UPI001BABCF0D|nr:hypothetical protein [Bradyrhizobium liaoningense]MBR0717723.1 hypothetical protein [Bradyrhizobium liaoningense]
MPTSKRAPGVLSSLAISPAGTRDQLVAELIRHPLFESARRYREADLADYDPATALVQRILIMTDDTSAGV